MATFKLGKATQEVDEDSISRDLSKQDLLGTKSFIEASPDINAASIKLARKGTFSSSSPNRRINHLVRKEA